MPRGRPKKIHSITEEIKSNEETTEEIEQEEKEPDYQFCYYCDRKLEGQSTIVAKGDQNQYRFCSIECYNLDQT